MVDRSPLLYCGHHKCATRWLVDIITDACRRIDLRFFEVYEPEGFDWDLPAFLEGSGIEFLAYTNAQAHFLEGVDDRRGFHVVRDPRDLLVSAYFSHRYSHHTDNWSDLAKLRRQLEQCSEEEGLILEMDFVDHVYKALESWDYGQEGMLELKMEELCSKAYEGLVDVFLHLGLLEPEEIRFDDELQRIADRARTVEPVSRRIQRSELLHIIYSHRFSAKAGGREVGQEDRHSHYRRGQAGDWRNHFTPELSARFKERYGGLLIQLGYESDDGW
jgi:hypothetical protein